MDTGDAMAVTNGPQAPSAPAWSPDGTQLAFLQLVPRPALVIGTPLAPPPGATWAPPPKYTDALVFRFDGVGEVPVGFTHIFVVRADGGAPRQLSKGDFNHGGVLAVAAWSGPPTAPS
jgi:Tol biopolymer transport system component